MSPLDQPNLCLDFDGVLHAYTSGWKGPTVIPDRLVPGARRFLEDAIEAFRVSIFSTRSGHPLGIAAMRDWLIAELVAEQMTLQDACRLVDRIHFPTAKPAAFVTLDDRALTFTGQWPAIADLKAFRTWWEKEKAAPNV